MALIAINKDTPFDKAGERVTLREFRLKYSYVCTESVSDEELLNYLATNPTTQEWFTVVKVGNRLQKETSKAYFKSRDRLPLEMIIDGVTYRKEMDGTYWAYVTGTQLVPGNQLYSQFPATIQTMIEERHAKLIWVFHKDVNSVP